MTDPESPDSPDTETESIRDPTPEGPDDPTPSPPTDPSPDVPEQSVPEQSIPSLEDRYSDVDPALRAGFWRIVLTFKFALIGLTVGSLLIGFRGAYTRGGQILLAGAVLGVYGYYRARTLKARADAGEFDHDFETDQDTDSTTTDQ